MTLKKYVKSRRKFKLFLLLMVVCLIFLTIVLLKSSSQNDITAGPYFRIPQKVYNFERDEVVPEKYNEQEIKSRLIKDKIKLLTQHKEGEKDDDEKRKPLQTQTKHVHIFYTLPVVWFKKTKARSFTRIEGNTTEIIDTTRTPNIAFYPSMGLYKPTSAIVRKHFENIRSCGIGVVVLASGTKLTEKLFKLVLDLAPRYNLTVTLEISSQQNKSVEHIKQQLLWARNFVHERGFYKVFSESKKTFVPLIYVRNAYKIDPEEKSLCYNQIASLRETALDAIFVGHIRLKQHTELMRRQCYDGFYTRLPSNGATYASTWKNWSYLRSFAQTYKMLFIPSVGPGYAERNKLPRHGNIQRHRSNGRYYGVAWRTAISNHVGFISISSYNNWQEGSQIEESVSHPGFADYSPGKPMKYLTLTTHWLDNFIKSWPKTQNSCQEFTNNTVC